MTYTALAGIERRIRHDYKGGWFPRLQQVGDPEGGALVPPG